MEAVIQMKLKAWSTSGKLPRLVKIHLNFLKPKTSLENFLRLIFLKKLVAMNMAQLIKCLPYKHKELHLDLNNHRKAEYKSMYL